MKTSTSLTVLIKWRTLKRCSNITFFKQIVKRIVPKYTILSFIILSPVRLYGAFDDHIPSAQKAACASAITAVSMGAESMYTNPAAMFHQNSFHAVTSYTKPFNLKEINMGTVTACYSSEKYAFGTGIYYFGNQLYYENQLAAGGQISLSPAIRVGGTLRYARLSIQQYGDSGTLIGDLGALVHFSDHITWGIVVKNANSAHIGKSKEPLPHVLATGLAFHVIESLQLTLDIAKESRFPLDACSSLEYKLTRLLALRCGVGSHPARFTAGFGINISRIKIDYAFRTHNDLGFTHLFSVHFSK